MLAAAAPGAISGSCAAAPSELSGKSNFGICLKSKRSGPCLILIGRFCRHAVSGSCPESSNAALRTRPLASSSRNRRWVRSWLARPAGRHIACLYSSSLPRSKMIRPPRPTRARKRNRFGGGSPLAASSAAAPSADGPPEVPAGARDSAPLAAGLQVVVASRRCRGSNLSSWARAAVSTVSSSCAHASCSTSTASSPPSAPGKGARWRLSTSSEGIACRAPRRPCPPLACSATPWRPPSFGGRPGIPYRFL
mmetsp:Transcript_58726/g.134711  ORF Transcript_58726/g.134711 Transcript_58726/m.134711 type:complete len:251 (+) Transcript_58726:852-1604(+)